MNPDETPPSPVAASETRSTVEWAVTAIAILAFVVPLFVGLGRWDMRNDEAIYSYAVERVLETGDWLTPRAIPGDAPFLEKPPLKFWVVAGAMAAGLTPNDEFGMRVFDALFGAVAFLYVLAFGRRLAGALCGAIALLVLFAFDPIVFDHGLRSNNMEAALVLSYCGGIWHFLRWTEEQRAGRRRLHAFAFAGYFVLGFMTKFVAVVFLPLVAVVALPLKRRGLERLSRSWKDWLWPLAASLALVLPWFIYQSEVAGRFFWQTIFGQHVYARFTASLDPEHLQPWYFYFTQNLVEFDYGDSFMLVLAGVALVIWRAWRGDALSRVVLAWWLLPIVLISLGTSKLIHYSFPFIPALALGAGWAGVTLLRTVDTRLRRHFMEGTYARRAQHYVRARPALRGALLLVCGLSVAAAAWTFVAGEPLTITLGGLRVFRNSSVPRPLIIAAALLILTGYSRATSFTAAVGVLIFFLPLQVYGQKVRRVLSVDHPLRTVKACILDEQAAGRVPVGGAYLTDPTLVSHPPSYYLRHIGEWRTGPEGWQEEATARLASASTPVILSDAQWRLIHRGLPDSPGTAPGEGANENTLKGLRIADGVLLLLPGPYSVCAAQAVAEGAQPFRGDTDLP